TRRHSDLRGQQNQSEQNANVVQVFHVRQTWEFPGKFKNVFVLPPPRFAEKKTACTNFSACPPCWPPCRFMPLNTMSSSATATFTTGAAANLLSATLPSKAKKFPPSANSPTPPGKLKWTPKEWPCRRASSTC